MTAVLSGGYTPLMMACEDGNLQSVRALLQSDSLEARNQAGYTPLGLAIKSGHESIVRELIASGADVNSQNNAGQSMLFLACWRKNKAMVKSLLAAGSDVNRADQRGWTPLMIAVYNDLREIVGMLLDSKPDLDAKDCFGKKAIDRAKTNEMRTILQDAVVASQYDFRPAPQPIARDCDSVARFLDTQDRLFRRSKEKLRDFPESLTEDNRKTSGKEQSSVRGVLRPSSSEASLRRQSPRREEETAGKGRMREELDKHIKLSVNSLGAKLASGNIKQMQNMLNSELEKATEILQSEVDSALSRSAKEVYDRLRHNLFIAIDDAMRERGMKLGPTQLLEQDWRVEIANRRRKSAELIEEPIKAYEMLLATPPTRDLSLGKLKSGATYDELKAELLSHVTSHTDDLESRLAKVTRGCIAKEVSAKVQKTKTAILASLRESLTAIAAEIESRLSGLMQARITEIVEANFLRSNPPASALRPGELTISTVSPNSPSADFANSQDKKGQSVRDKTQPKAGNKRNSDLPSSEKGDVELEEELLQSPQNARPPTKRSVSEKRPTKSKSGKSQGQKVSFVGESSKD